MKSTRRGVPLAVDNTFLTAVGQRPLELGADVVIYSTTKYVEGHNVSVGGAILTDDDTLSERLFYVRKTIGAIQTPFQAWLTLRGLKTLPLRLRAHLAGAPGSGLARGQVQDVGAIPGPSRLDQRSAAGQLHVIGMRRDRQQVNRGWHGRN